MSDPPPTPAPPPAIASIAPPSSSSRMPRSSDAAGSAMGIGLAVLVHGVVAAASLRLGGNEGNVARSAAAPQAEPQVIETHLLQRGGGTFDPRHVVHREAPVLAERAAPQQVAVARDPTQVQLRPDAGAQDYMAAITGRTRQGRGNQDLAERLAALAANEQAADPSQAGPGSPSGSAVGDTTDPALATRGAATKIDEFLRLNIRISSALTGAERRMVVFRIRLDDAGAIVSAEIVQNSGNDSLDGEILGQAQALASRHARIESLTPEEAQQVANRNVVVRVPIDRMQH
ncbi:MAG: hypothetical protein JNK72_12225 [Myxococcales bacterium]|nr:hypothetical protein [Myxococcales bacterium]